jgi:pimeloyl-ACP methyl ester carboxylesterase
MVMNEDELPSASVATSTAATSHRPPAPNREPTHDQPQSRRSLVRIAVGSAAFLMSLAALANWLGRRSERAHPPIGDFIDVDGVLLHYVDVGEGDPVVLLHGNGSMLQDPYLGIVDLLASKHRVILFDRPGFGYSERPRDTTWTPEAQMELISRALGALGVEKPVLYGHSWGACLVVTYALRRPEELRGVVAASGYYYPTRRLDAALAELLVAPVIGPIVRNTIFPLLGAVTGTAIVKALFSPNPIPSTYAEFPAGLALRPAQLRAAAEDGTILRNWALRTSPHYGEIRVPVVIVAGDGDKAVDHRAHAMRLHRDIPGSRLRIWADTGHMVHHARPHEVVDAIEEVFAMADQRQPASAPRSDQAATGEVANVDS